MNTQDRNSKAAIGIVAGAAIALAAGYAFSAGWLTPHRLTPKQIVSSFEKNSGEHPGYRRNHATGVCVAGHFDGNGSLSRYSSASVFRTQSVPVIGRFAIPGGNPSIADSSSPVRSLALEFTQADKEQWRTGMNSTPVFAVRTPQAFYENLLASQPSPSTGKPDPARLAAFYSAHPESAHFKQWLSSHPASSSFGNTTFYSINAFELVANNGARQLVRWSLTPELPYAPYARTAGESPTALRDDLQARLKSAPLRYHLVFQLAQPGDRSDDATQAWPDDRQTIDAGTLTITSASDQEDGPCRDINFDPTILPTGIAPSNDPLLAARSAAYARSHLLRTHEEAFKAGDKGAAQ